MMDLSDLYQELIMDHGTQPRNYRVLQDASHAAEGDNPLCGDQIHLYLKILNSHITEASFQGRGCAISTASASLMTELLLGKTVEEAQELLDYFQQLMTSESTCPAALGKLSALLGVRAYPARIKCATLAWHALQAALKQKNTKISTE